MCVAESVDGGVDFFYAARLAHFFRGEIGVAAGACKQMKLRAPRPFARTNHSNRPAPALGRSTRRCRTPRRHDAKDSDRSKVDRL